ncbi:hypothetical protein HYZ80_01990 [Candidatus Parcubacteria bacterium]|nr:hypothetical protein [Candidatus Parcubacteria bacterium]
MATVAHRLPYGALTKAILTTLAAGSLVLAVATLPGLALALRPFLPRRRHHSTAVRQATYRLAKQRLVKLQQRGRRTTVALTETGKQRALRYRVANLAIKKPKQWDGRWRIVIFDIPEERKAVREALRAKFRSLEFYQLQRSVFITPYACREVIEFLKSYFHIDRYVHYGELTAIDCDRFLREQFEV